MEVVGVDVSVGAAALHICKKHTVDSWCHSVMMYFLVSCFCNPGTEQRQRGQSVELRQCQMNQDSALLQRDTNECNSDKGIGESERRPSEKGGHATSAQGLAICHETNEGTKHSLGLDYNISAGAARQNGYDFRFKHCASNGGKNLNAADKRGGRTGLNLHFILIILFSTNKLTPEKT
ncbi:hypothetical protein Q5P01_010142 [Channa striata]|uniref:Uncharacterized protein n=1 Tax=Channa striata TaxID=64152 RepID=A0AA88N0X2_CHASR|nr:hypothetical protein Q5P01_010142 [Channa striata]